MEAFSDRDALLLERIRAGDDHALAAIYDQHGGLVYGLARRVARDERLACDVTKEVFTYLWEMPHRVDLSCGSLRTYLALLTHRRVVEEVRRRRAETAAAPPEAEAEIGGVAESTAGNSGKEGTTLERLPAEERRALQLAYYEGLTYVQVAKVLGIPESTAKTLLRGALDRLRMLFTEEAREEIS